MAKDASEEAEAVARAARPEQLTPEDMAARLRAFLARERGAPEAAVSVAGLQRLAGGSSREIWSFKASLPGEAGPEELDLVMRRDPPGRTEENSRDLEFRVVRAAHEAGVPVPRPHACCADPAVLGTPFYLMDRVPGEALPRRLLRDARYARAREKMIGQLAGILVRIHAIDPDRPELAGLPASPPGESAARAEIARLAEGIRAMAAEPHPVLALAERWLLARVPPRARRTLVHGDYRVGNVLFDEDGVRAILDWELAKLGDPVEDLGWLCTRAWRFGADERPAGGLGSREELLEAYAAAGGEKVDPAHLRFWEALGSYKVALVFIQQSWVYRTGRVDSLELAALGRRIAEAEEALIELMQEDA
jgi:aminoglycoside phosphotransferase (APT) family kinase protein